MAPTRKRNLRKPIVKIHLILAMIFSIPILLLALTGTILAFERELERLFYPHLYQVPVGDQKLPMQVLFERVQAAFPEKTLRTIRLPQVEGEAVRFQTRDRIPHEYFVDPYTGDIVGRRKLSSSIAAVTRTIHVSFLLGKIGGRITGATSLLFLVTLCSGLYLWWSSRIRKKKAFLEVRGKRGWFIANFDLHNLIGVLAALPLAVLCVTGAVFSFPEFFRPLIYTVTQSSAPPPRPSKLTVPEHTEPYHLDRLLALSAQAAPNTWPTIIGLPREPDSPLRINRRAPGQAHHTGQHYTYLNPWTEEVIEQISPAQFSTGYHVIMTNRVLHTGEWGGLPLRILFFLTTFAAIPLVMSGLVHWWGRKRNQARRSKPRRAAAKAKCSPEPLTPMSEP